MVRWRFWVVATLAALVFRVLLLATAPRHGYPYDHDDQVRWGIQATDEGLLTLYDHPPRRHPMRLWREGRWETSHRTLDRLFSYPPSMAYIVYTSGLAHRQISDDRLVNTIRSRAVFGVWGVLADFATALGCAWLVATLRARPKSPLPYGRGSVKPGSASAFGRTLRRFRETEPASHREISEKANGNDPNAFSNSLSTDKTARLTYLLVLLLPPIAWDTIGWSQTETVLLAPAVWMLVAMVRRRWLMAGLLLGLAASLKPQAVLFAPIWMLVLLTQRPLLRSVMSLLLAGVVFLASAVPFMVHSGWSWLRISYIANLLEAFPQTTLKAFNLWYVDLLLTKRADAGAVWLGLTKDTCGKVFLAAALAAGLAYMTKRWRSDVRGLVLWAALSLLACVMLPTRVHERYLVLALPLLIVCAMLWRRMIPGVAMIVVVAVCQLTWPLWLGESPGNWARFELRTLEEYTTLAASTDRERKEPLPTRNEYLAQMRDREKPAYLARRARTLPWEWSLTVLALAGTAATAAAAMTLSPSSRRRGRRRGSDAPPPDLTCKTSQPPPPCRQAPVSS